MSPVSLSAVLLRDGESHCRVAGTCTARTELGCHPEVRSTSGTLLLLEIFPALMSIRLLLTLNVLNIVFHYVDVSAYVEDHTTGSSMDSPPPDLATSFFRVSSRVRAMNVVGVSVGTSGSGRPPGLRGTLA